MPLYIITDNWELLSRSIWLTFWLVFVSLIIGLMIAIPTAIMASSNQKIISLPAKTYMYIFRGTPLLIQLYFFYYGFGLLLGDITGIRETFWWDLIRSALPFAIMAFALNTGAYTAEIVRGYIVNIDQREVEAGKAFGMSKLTLLCRVILPDALRRSLPAYGNEIIYMLHGSSLVSTITVLDLTGAARQLRDTYYNVYVPFIFAACLYLMITLLIVFVLRIVENKVLAYTVR